MILCKVYKALFPCKDFLHWDYKPNLSATFLLALEMEFEKGLCLHNEGYETDVYYYLSQLIMKFAHIHMVTSAAKASFYPIDDQEPTVPIFPSTPNGRPVEHPLY